MKILRIFRKDNPLITAYAELPHRGGKPFGWSHADFLPSPKGKGDRKERAVDEGCFRLSWAFQICITTATSCTHTGICLAGAVFRCWHIVVTRLSRRVTPTRLEKNIFRPRGRRSLCSLGVRPKNLSAFRFARLACVLVTFVHLALLALFSLPLGFIDGCRRQF